MGNGECWFISMSFFSHNVSKGFLYGVAKIHDCVVKSLCPTKLTLNPLTHMPILGSSNSAANKEMMSKNSQMGIQCSDWVENIVGKEEIARYEFSHNVFKSCLLLMR